MNYKQLLGKKRISLSGLIIVGIIVAGQYAGVFSHTSGSLAQKAQQNQPGLYKIDHFVDGDTIAINMNGTTESIRMIGIDTPETHKPNTPVQCYGPAASAYTKQMIGSGLVRLESDPQSTNRDRYNRLLRYVYTQDGQFLNLQLVQNGYAFTYTQFPFTKSDTFVQAQAVAKADNKGLWGNCVPVQESNGRWQSNTM